MDERYWLPGGAKAAPDSASDSVPASKPTVSDGHRCNGACGFPRSARLLDGKAYGQVFRKNLRLGNRHWSVLARRRGDDQVRLGLAIAKKRARRAVDRNLLKRLVRESFRHRQQTLGGFDLVVMNRDAAAKADRTELRQSLDRIWHDLQRRARQSAV